MDNGRRSVERGVVTCASAITGILLGYSTKRLQLKQSSGILVDKTSIAFLELAYS
jgi:hypothetical protein